MPGKLFTWGRASFGRLGNGTTTPDVASPAQIGSDVDWDFVSAGENHALAIRNGQLWAWGNNGDGQLGDGTQTGKTSPVRIGTDSDWMTVSAGSSFSLALKINGTLWAWGINDSGRNGTGAGRTSPTQIGSDTDWEAIAAGRSHSLALKNGALFSWGGASNGKLGNNTTTPNISSPAQIGADSDWTAISAGEEHSLAIKDGKLYACGSDFRGQQGNGATTGNILVFTQIGSNTDWTAIDCAALTSYGLRGGALYAWGLGSGGQIGNGGTTTSNPSPIQVGSDTDWTWISGGLETGTQQTHALGIKNGALYAWGHNQYGQLGDGTTTQRNSPVQIGVSTEWLSASAGAHFSVARQVGEVAPSNTAVPTITGVAKSNETLSSSTGSWTGSPEPTYSYQWQSSSDGTTWTDIADETEWTLLVPRSVIGKYLRVAVTATNSVGSATAYSSATLQVEADVPEDGLIWHSSRTNGLIPSDGLIHWPRKMDF